VAAVAAHANIKAAVAAVAVAAVAVAKANNAPPKAAGTVSALAAAVVAAAPAAVVAVVKPSDSFRQNHGGLYGPPFLDRFPSAEKFPWQRPA
jgi:hypothetical protein